MLRFLHGMITVARHILAVSRACNPSEAYVGRPWSMFAFKCGLLAVRLHVCTALWFVVRPRSVLRLSTYWIAVTMTFVAVRFDYQISPGYTFKLAALNLITFFVLVLNVCSIYSP